MNVDLRQLLIEIQETLPQLPREELNSLNIRWYLVEQLSSDKNSNLQVFLQQLADSIRGSQTLVDHGFLTLISSPFARFDPEEDSHSVNDNEDCLPAVHNEVIEIANLLDELLSQRGR